MPGSLHRRHRYSQRCSDHVFRCGCPGSCVRRHLHTPAAPRSRRQRLCGQTLLRRAPGSLPVRPKRYRHARTQPMSGNRPRPPRRSLPSPGKARLRRPSALDLSRQGTWPVPCSRSRSRCQGQSRDGDRRGTLPSGPLARELEHQSYADLPRSDPVGPSPRHRFNATSRQALPQHLVAPRPSVFICGPAATGRPPHLDLPSPLLYTPPTSRGPSGPCALWLP
jgi:hypothetical protein